MGWTEPRKWDRQNGQVALELGVRRKCLYAWKKRAFGGQAGASPRRGIHPGRHCGDAIPAGQERVIGLDEPLCVAYGTRAKQ